MTDTVTVEIAGRRLALRRLDKVLYPACGVTKADLIDYARRVAPAWLAQLSGRPVTRRRWPDGVGGNTSFFEKNLPGGTPDWVERVTLASPGSTRDREEVTYPLVTDLAGLAWLLNLAALELHVPQYRVGPDGSPGRPDRIVIDLDPGPGTGLGEVSAVAGWAGLRMRADGLHPVPVTSGSKGLQLYAALVGEQDGDQVLAYAHDLARDLEREHPQLVVSRMARSIRPGRVLVDWSQNSPAKTTVCPYSPRGLPGATVAAPRRWDELGEGLRQLTLAEVAERFDAEGDLLGEPGGPPARLP